MLAMERWLYFIVLNKRRYIGTVPKSNARIAQRCTWRHCIELHPYLFLACVPVWKRRFWGPIWHGKHQPLVISRWSLAIPVWSGYSEVPSNIFSTNGSEIKPWWAWQETKAFVLNKHDKQRLIEIKYLALLHLQNKQCLFVVRVS